MKLNAVLIADRTERSPELLSLLVPVVCPSRLHRSSIHSSLMSQMLEKWKEGSLTCLMTFTLENFKLLVQYNALTQTLYAFITY